MTPRASKFCWKMNEFRLSAVRQRHLADERYYYWDREYTSLSSVHLPTEFWRPWWRLPRSTSKCKIGFRGLTAETFWFDPNWSTLWRVLTLAEMEYSQKKIDKPLINFSSGRMVQRLHLHYCICIGMVCSLKIVLYGRRPCPKIIVAARQEGAGRE